MYSESTISDQANLTKAIIEKVSKTDSVHHSFNVDIATELGSVELATLVQYFAFQTGINQNLERNFHNGKYWTLQTLDEIAKNFPYLSRSQVERMIKKLVEFGVIEKGNFNSALFDRTNWYAFTGRFEEKTSAPKNMTFTTSISKEV